MIDFKNDGECSFISVLNESNISNEDICAIVYVYDDSYFFIREIVITLSRKWLICCVVLLKKYSFVV